MALDGAHAAPAGAAPGSRTVWLEQALVEHEGRLVAYARRLLGDPERARDAVQEAFLRLCRKRPEEVADVRRWLFTVCRNHAMDQLRRRRHVETSETDVVTATVGTQPAPDSVVAEGEAARAALAALDRLPAKEREVLHLKFAEGLSYREIAALTGFSLSHVGVLIHTGLERLRGRLAPVLGVEAASRGATR